MCLNAILVLDHLGAGDCTTEIWRRVNSERRQRKKNAFMQTEVANYNSKARRKESVVMKTAKKINNWKMNILSSANK